jgi:hypothetical protein
VTGVLIGDSVWIGIATALVVWLAATTAAGARRLPSIGAVVRWFLQCWLGRFLLLAAWAEVGWHLFCQRP